MKNHDQAIRKFNRFELKHLISLKQAEEIKKTLKTPHDPRSQWQRGWSLCHRQPVLRLPKL